MSVFFSFWVVIARSKQCFTSCLLELFRPIIAFPCLLETFYVVYVCFAKNDNAKGDIVSSSVAWYVWQKQFYVKVVRVKLQEDVKDSG